MWRDMDPIWLVEQILQLLYGTVIIIVNGVALELVRVVDTNPTRVS